MNPRGERWRATARRAIIGRIHAIWPADRAAVLDAMLIGDASSIGRDVRNDFQGSGTYHILVVSGFNVGILEFVLFWMLRRLPTGDVVATIITLLLAAGYTYLTNAGPPVIRATVMLAIYLITPFALSPRGPAQGGAPRQRKRNFARVSRRRVP